MTAWNPTSLVPLSFVLLATSGCATIDSETTELKNPEFADRTWTKVCVAAPAGDLAARQKSEERIVTAIRDAGGEAVAWGELLFLGQDYEEEEIANRVRNAGCDAVLVFTSTDTWTEERVVPPTATTFSDPWFGYGAWGRLHPYGYPYGPYGFTSTTVQGGYSLSLPRAIYELRLVDSASEGVAWIATTRVAGTSDSDWDALRERAVDDAIDAWLRAGLQEGLRAPRGARD